MKIRRRRWTETAATVAETVERRLQRRRQHETGYQKLSRERSWMEDIPPHVLEAPVAANKARDQSVSMLRWEEMKIPAADKGMKEVLGIALRCIRSVSERPGIKTVYEDLSSI